MSDGIKRTVLGVGYNSGGKHTAYIVKTPTKEYTTWKNMLRRCYCEKTHKLNPSYADCVVSSEWHDFQVFAEWLSNHEYNGLGYHLDKDLLIRGNKVYGADTCCLVPQEVNKLLYDHSRKIRKYPKGVYLHKFSGRYHARVVIENRNESLGYFDCPSKAHDAYVEAKEFHVKRKAAEWKDRIEPSVFDALMEWSVSHE